MLMNYKITNRLLEVIAKFEGFVATPYKAPEGNWAIGYGTTFRFAPEEVMQKLEDMNVKKYNDRWVGKITKKQALELKIIHLEREVLPHFNKFAEEVKAATGFIIPQDMADALIDFIYNLGIGGFLKSSVPKKMKKAPFCIENVKKVNATILKYVYSNRKFYRGLLHRRAETSNLWWEGWSNYCNHYKRPFLSY